MALLFGYYIFEKQKQASVSHDKESEYCHNELLPEATVLIIDHSDSINSIQKSALEKLLLDLSHDVKQYGSLTVYSVREQIAENLEPDLTLCNPGDAATVSNLTGNKRLAEREYTKKFKNVISTKLDELMQAEPSNNSPIMQTIQVAASESFLGRDNAAQEKNLVVVSDMLENTPEFSFFKSGAPNFKSFKNDPQWLAVQSDLKNTAVSIYFLRRKGSEKIQTPQLKDFWQKFFLEQGAKSVQFKKIPG